MLLPGTMTPDYTGLLFWERLAYEFLRGLQAVAEFSKGLTSNAFLAHCFPRFRTLHLEKMGPHIRFMETEEFMKCVIWRRARF